MKNRAVRREPMAMQKRPTYRGVVAGVPNLTGEIKFVCFQVLSCEKEPMCVCWRDVPAGRVLPYAGSAWTQIARLRVGMGLLQPIEVWAYTRQGPGLGTARR